MIAVQGNRIVPVVNYKNWQGVGCQVSKQGIDLSNMPDAVLYLPGYPGTGNTIHDRSGSSPLNHGTITGATWVREASGIWVNNFDGVDDVINCGDNISLDVVAAFTLEAWVKLSSLTALWFVAGRDSILDRNFYIVGENTGQAAFTCWKANVAYTNNFTILKTTGIWYHLVGVYNGVDTRGYTNGTLDCTPVALTGNIDNDNVSFTIGMRAVDNDRDLDGKIAMVTLYNRALTAEEIQQNYQTTRHLFGI